VKIIQSEIIPVLMPQKDPNWRFALGGRSITPSFILKLNTDEGIVGYGYTGASASHHGITQGGVRAALETYVEKLKGEDPFQLESIFGRLNRVLAGNNGAKSAIEIALYDLQAKALNLPLYALLGGLFRKEIPIVRILGLKEPGEMASRAAGLVEEGFNYLKIKLSGEPAKDIQRVKEIRKAVGDSVHFIVDANQMYEPKVAIDVLKRMVEYGVETCEQPVKADDWQGLMAVTRAVDCRVEAHESVKNLEDVFGLVKGKVVDSINLKVDQIGGLRNTKIAAAICKVGNVTCRVSATGSQILSAACMHIVASTENVTEACELGEFARVLNDPGHGLEIEGGKLKVPSGQGIGISIQY
jgi:L-alanine-DL-glutamate epimerase-like enolase superfamily enzyme